jgi:hypothetical protein
VLEPGYSAAMKKIEYQCCFCGGGITEDPPDPCNLVLTYNNPDNPEGTQYLWSHARCLKQRLHSSVPVPF